MSLSRKYVQLLFGFGFGGVEDCPIHEQSRVRLTEQLGCLVCLGKGRGERRRARFWNWLAALVDQGAVGDGFLDVQSMNNECPSVVGSEVMMGNG